MILNKPWSVFICIIKCFIYMFLSITNKIHSILRLFDIPDLFIFIKFKYYPKSFIKFFHEIILLSFRMIISRIKQDVVCIKFTLLKFNSARKEENKICTLIIFVIYITGKIFRKYFFFELRIFLFSCMRF